MKNLFKRHRLIKAEEKINALVKNLDEIERVLRVGLYSDGMNKIQHLYKRINDNCDDLENYKKDQNELNQLILDKMGYRIKPAAIPKITIEPFKETSDSKKGEV